MELMYQTPAPQKELEAQGEKIAKLTRHLKARLEEFECITLSICCEETGCIKAQFQGYDPVAVAEGLYEFRKIKVVVEEDGLVFYLRGDQPHEHIDTVWGGLFTTLF